MRRWLALAAVSLGVHLAVVVGLLLSPYAHFLKPRAKVAQTVRIRIIERAAPAEKEGAEAPAAAKKGAEAPAKKTVRQATAKGGKPAARAKPTKPAAQAARPAPKDAGGKIAYSDLLPGKSWQPKSDGTADSAVGVAEHGEGVPEARAVADLAGGKLDIPLVFRKGGTSAKALAKLVHRPGLKAQWQFAYVDGEPILRAVLFESLRDPKNWPVVLKLFRELKSEEVLVSLRQRTVLTKQPHGEAYGESYSVLGNKVVIDRVRYSVLDSSEMATPADLVAKGESLLPLGITLPDHEADRAKWRDRVNLAKLEESPAFHGPIRDREP